MTERRKVEGTGFEAFLCMAGDPDTVKASLGGETVEVLLDTGSKPFSFISRVCAEKHKGQLVRRERSLSGKTLTGARFECEAYVEAVLQMRGKTIKANLFILDSLPFEIVLGKADIRAYRLWDLVIGDEVEDVLLEGNPDRNTEGVEEEEDLIEAYPIPYVEELKEDKFPEMVPEFRALLEEFADVFSKVLPAEGALIPPMEIRLIPELAGKSLPKSMQMPPRRYSKDQQEEIEKMVKSLNPDVIEPCNSAFYSQVHMVWKKGGGYRMTIDFRALNSITLGLGYPLPLIKELNESLGAFCFFSKIDLTMAYHQIRLAAKAQSLCVFKTHNGMYVWKKMPMGLKGAAAYFQQMLETLVLEGLIGLVCRVYIDDIIVFGRTNIELLANTRLVLERLRKFRICAKKSKVEMCKAQIDFLGVSISQKGVQITMDRKEALKQVMLPKTSTQLKSFLGMMNFVRDFIPGVTEKAKPLYDLTSKSKHALVVWNEATERNFLQLREDIYEAVTLSYVEETGDLILYADASEYGIGGVLKQQVGLKENTIGYFSKSLNQEQRRWSVTEKEMWAIVFGLRNFKFFIGNRKVIVRTDHRAIPSSKHVSASAKVERWKLSQQAMDVWYTPIAGNLQFEADWMSRAERETTVGFCLGASADVKALIGSFHTNKAAIGSFHGQGAGHWGIENTLDKMKDGGFDWEGMRRDVSDYVSSCTHCQKIKSGAFTKGQPFNTECEVYGKRWAMDSKSMEEDQFGFSAILVVIDMFSREVLLQALKTLTATETVDVLEMLISAFGSEHLCEFQHDPGSQFLNEEMARLCKRHKIAQLVTVTGWKQQNGMVERVIRTMGEQLSGVMFDLQIVDWSRALEQTQRILNANVHSAIGVAPWRIREGDAEAVEIAQESIRKRKGSKEGRLAGARFKLGDWILRRIMDRRKLDVSQHRWHGPYEVMSCDENIVQYRNDGGKRVEVFVGEVKLFKHREGEIMELRGIEEQSYVVEKIIDHSPKREVLDKLREIKLTVVYEGYEPAVYWLHENKDLRFTQAFQDYAELHPALKRYSLIGSIVK